MDERRYERCLICRQLIDPLEPDELAHHARQQHAPMPGIPDDGLETIPLDLEKPRGRSWADGPEGKATPIPAPIYRDARKGRRKKSDFES